MADVSDLALTAEDLADAMASLRDAWCRRNPGILDDLLPEAIRMTDPQGTSLPKVTTLYEDCYVDRPMNRLAKADAVVNYREAGEGVDATCYGCRFYDWGRCQLVEGTIEADNVCDLHRPAPRLSIDMVFAESATLRPEKGVGKNGQVFHDFRRPRTFTVDASWIQFLPPPGTYHHLAYGELELTAEKYARIVQNFADGIYGQTLPINAEHDMPASGAVGYITAMRIADDGSIEVKPEWNERGQQLIEGDRFRYVSAEYFEAWQDPVTGEWHDDVAFGMAICTNPHFKETVLRPLAASETRRSTQPAPRREGAPRMSDPKEQKTVTLAEEDLKQLRETAGRVEAAEKRAETLEQQNAELAERVSTMEKAARRQRFTDLVAGRGGSNDGQPWFGEPDKHVNLLETLAAQFGEESDEVTGYIEQQQGIAAQLKSSKLFTEIGTSQGGAGDVDAKVAALVEEKRKANSKLTPEQAEAEVYAEHQDLYEAALGEGK